MSARECDATIVRPERRKGSRRAWLNSSFFGSKGKPRAFASASSWLLSPTRLPIRSHTSGGFEFRESLSVTALRRAFAASGKRCTLLSTRGFRPLGLAPLIIPPATEHGDRIKDASVVGLAATVLVEQRADGTRLPEATIGRARGRPCFVGEIAEASDEPVGERHLETELSALGSGLR